MSCQNNDCLEPNPCDPNPCYEDCGCLNPTTFECITKPGTLSTIGITNNMNGKQVLEAIAAAINNIVPGEDSPASDVNAKVSIDDTTTGYLGAKIINGSHINVSIASPGGNEKVKIAVTPNTLISSNAGNLLDVGTDGKLRVLSTGDASTTYITEGSGVDVTGAGSAEDPFVISTNPTIQVARSCFDGVWRNIPIVATGNPAVAFVSGTPKYRIRYDGTIEFKGSATYTVAYGAYSTGSREHTITFGALPTTCLSADEQSGAADLKSISYIDVPQASDDQITQSYSYTIRKSNNSIQLKFQSSFTAATTKTVVVNFDGAVSHPNI